MPELPYYEKESQVDEGTGSIIGYVDQEAREAYLQECIAFAGWDGPDSNEIIQRLAISSHIHEDDEDANSKVPVDSGIRLLRTIRDEAYSARLNSDIEEILGTAIGAYDISDFAGVVADNWEGEPLESCDDFVEDQRDVVFELFGAYKAMQDRAAADPDAVPDRFDAIGSEIAASLRAATTRLAERKIAEDAESEVTRDKKAAFRKALNALVPIRDDLFKQINDLAVMLWNARFPDDLLPEDAKIYLPDRRNPRVYTDLTLDSWDGNSETMQGRTGLAIADRIPLGVRSCFRFDGTEYQPWVTVTGNGAWLWCHGRQPTKGGVTSTKAFIEKVTAKLEAFKK